MVVKTFLCLIMALPQCWCGEDRPHINTVNLPKTHRISPKLDGKTIKINKDDIILVSTSLVRFEPMGMNQEDFKLIKNFRTKSSIFAIKINSCKPARIFVSKIIAHPFAYNIYLNKDYVVNLDIQP